MKQSTYHCAPRANESASFPFATPCGYLSRGFFAGCISRGIPNYPPSFVAFRCSSSSSLPPLLDACLRLLYRRGRLGKDNDVEPGTGACSHVSVTRYIHIALCVATGIVYGLRLSFSFLYIYFFLHVGLRCDVFACSCNAYRVVLDSRCEQVAHTQTYTSRGSFVNDPSCTEMCALS